MSDMFNNIDLLKLILKWKKQLAVVVVLAFVMAFVFSLPVFITPLYRSTAVIYPSNLIPYGIETPTEQMLQLFESNQIRQEVMRRHNLATHYDIDTTDRNPGNFSELYKTFDDHVRISKTEFEAVELIVMDSDPDSAYKISMSMIELFNKNTRLIHKKKSEEVVKIINAQMERKKLEIDSVSTLLKELKVKYGIIDYKSQAKEASKEYYRSLGTNSKKTADILVSLRNLEERGNEYIKLNEHMQSAISTFDQLRVEHDNAFRDVVKVLTYTNVVVKPVVADKKSYPVRWVICAFSMMSAFLVYLIGIIIIERFRR